MKETIMFLTTEIEGNPKGRFPSAGSQGIRSCKAQLLYNSIQALKSWTKLDLKLSGLEKLKMYIIWDHNEDKNKSLNSDLKTPYLSDGHLQRGHALRRPDVDICSVLKQEHCSIHITLQVFNNMDEYQYIVHLTFKNQESVKRIS